MGCTDSRNREAGTSTFRFSSPVISSKAGTWPLVIEGVLENTADRRADEVPQLYLSQQVRSVTPPRKELKGFQRLTLEPGEKRKYRFVLERRDLSFVGLDDKRTFEPGCFSVAVGSDSEAEADLLCTSTAPASSKSPQPRDDRAR